ncbi:hypothetical protein RJJ65_40355, partial [Rhizobium hidalgonense]
MALVVTTTKSCVGTISLMQSKKPFLSAAFLCLNFLGVFTIAVFIKSSLMVDLTSLQAVIVNQ